MPLFNRVFSGRVCSRKPGRIFGAVNAALLSPAFRRGTHAKIQPTFSTIHCYTVVHNQNRNVNRNYDIIMLTASSSCASATL